MKFSLITPAKPEELPQLLSLRRNLTHQTTSDFEWIIASTADLNLQDADWHTTFPIRIVHPQTPTPGAARNAAMTIAQGDWIVFLDSDDYLLPTALTQLAGTHALTPDVFGDLYQYPTYEPHASFTNSLNQGVVHDALPKWGGSKHKRFKNFSLNLSESAIAQLPDTLTPATKDWLQHKYFLYQGAERWAKFNQQLKISGKVVNRQLVTTAHLTFDETNSLYPDYHFLTQVMLRTTRYLQLANPTYIRVKHNDAINSPSLHQVMAPDRWQQRLASWQLSLKHLPDGDLREAFADYTIRSLHRYLYPALATKQPNPLTDTAELGQQLHDYLQQITTVNTTTGVNWLSRQILNHFQHATTVPQRRINLIVHLRQLKRVIKHHGRGITRLAYSWWFTRLPIKPRTIIYESFLGRNCSDSPKAIYTYLQQTYPGQFNHVWIMNPNTSNPYGHQPNTKIVKRFGWRYMYYLATAKYQVINMRQPKWFLKRPGTKFLATWHGTPLKHLVFDMDNVASANPHYKAIFYHQSRQWDYLVTANQFSVDVFEHAFMYPTQRMLPTGYPRNDILNAPDKQDRAQAIKQRLGIPLDKKIILYAPTWRDDDYYGVGDYKFTLKLDIARLKRELGHEYVLVLRTHYFITEHLDKTDFGDFVYNESSYDDISELYLISDVLITDYSSVFFDYAILKRPILFFVYDYEKYESVLRGFYLDMTTDLPGPLLKTNDAVVDALHHLPVLKQRYAVTYHRFSQRFNAWEDGHATQRVVDAVFRDDLS